MGANSIVLSQVCETSSLSTPPVLQTVAETVMSPHEGSGAPGEDGGDSVRFA